MVANGRRIRGESFMQGNAYLVEEKFAESLGSCGGRGAEVDPVRWVPIGRGAQMRHAILDHGTAAPHGTRIGFK